MIKKVVDYIRQYNMIADGDEVIAGVSGGADSVCMFLQLLEYKKQVNFDLKVVHINHLIREDASEDALFVKDLCDKNGIVFYLYEEDVEQQSKEQGLSTEEAGRRIRYLRFNEVMSSNTAKIAVAHNRNDVAETVLFNIFRGTGIEGLASLVPVNGNIIRPLIGVSREEIEQYLKDKKQSYKTDSTNASTDYARNKIRNVILPYAEDEIVNGATSHIAALSDKMGLVRRYIENEVCRAYKETVSVNKGVTIDLKSFIDRDQLIRQEIVLKAFDELTCGRKDIGQVHVEAVMSLVDKQGEKKVDLPYNLEAIKQYDTILIRKKELFEADFTEYIIEDGGCIELTDKCIKSRTFSYESGMVIPQNAYTKWFDYDKIVKYPCLRTRKTGDYLTVNDELQKKTLKEYMIDNKIPREERERQLIVADKDHVLWIIGYRISEYYKITETTKTILEITVE